MVTRKPVTTTHRGVVQATGEVHVAEWTDDRDPMHREETVICSCGFSEGPAKHLRIGVVGHFEAVGAVVQP